MKAVKLQAHRDIVLAPSESFLSWEVFMLGGCSILFCLACWAFTDKGASVYTISQLAFGLAFAANHPHFLSSYILLYSDFKKNIFQRPRYFWAAVIVPALLGGFLLYALAAGRADFLGHAVNLMFFLVGWHYVKQVFGCIIVTSARRKQYYAQWERNLMLSNLFSLWFLSFCHGQVGSSSFTFYGITYPSLGLPGWLDQAAQLAVAGSAAGVVLMHVWRYVEKGVRPNPSSVVALGALYVWYLPTFSHPGFAYMIPFFHSLQYLAFVWSFKKNQVTDQLAGVEGREWRVNWVRDFFGFAITALILGALSFEFIPKFIDAQNWLHYPQLGNSPVLAAVLLFINTHHYFIDNVIWKSDNEQVKKYLFADSAAAKEVAVLPMPRSA
jgi:hypothetical protein